MYFSATQYEKKILQEAQVCLNRTQEQYSILRRALKDFIKSVTEIQQNFFLHWKSL